MIKQIRICDRCKKRLFDDEKMELMAVICKGELKIMDFCGKCMADVARYVTCAEESPDRKSGEVKALEAVSQNGNTENRDGTEEKETRRSEKKAGKKTEKKTAAVPKPQKQPHRKMDYGKILALSNAGWDNAKIADEMGMTPQQVSNAKYVAKKKLEDGTLILGSGDEIDSMGGD